MTDTGIGIAEAQLSAVFEDFQQASSGTTRLYGGTGLGLAIVKNLVVAQGGTVDVKSKVGAGSTFSFVLRFGKTTEQPEADAPPVIELEPGLPDARILVVEDIALNQLLMQTLLEDFGFQMDVAADGQMAIEKLRTTRYDLVLMDLQMPVMNGFQATEYIRQELHLSVPIVALTADVTSVDLEKCRAAGMNDYLTKPIDEQLLYRKMVKFLKPGTPDHAAATTPAEGPTRPPSCVNFDYLKRITKSDARMAEMIGLYLQEIPQLVQAMKKAIADKDWRTLKLAAHSLIPTFATVGMAPEYEGITKSIQGVAEKQLATGTTASQQTMLGLLSSFSTIEAVCARAARELEEKQRLLAPLSSPVREAE